MRTTSGITGHGRSQDMEEAAGCFTDHCFREDNISGKTTSVISHHGCIIRMADLDDSISDDYDRTIGDDCIHLC